MRSGTFIRLKRKKNSLFGLCLGFSPLLPSVCLVLDKSVTKPSGVHIEYKSRTLMGIEMAGNWDKCLCEI